MNPTDLWPAGLGDWVRLVVGAMVWLAPGIVLADRIMTGRQRFLLAPVLSFSLLTLAAILLDFAVGVPVTAPSTAVLAVLLALWIGRPRIVSAARTAGVWLGTRTPLQWRRPQWRRLLAVALLALVFGGVAMVQMHPHLDTQDPGGAWNAYPAYAQAWLDAKDGARYPHPIHVDDYRHMADQGQIIRTGTVDIDHPYTGQSGGTPLFTVAGMRSERGFNVGMAQIEMVTGASMPLLALVLPALWAGYVAVLLVQALRPAPGALASGALVAIIPTTVRHLGPALLVPVALGQAWVVAVLLVATKARGGGRFTGLVLLVTGAFFIHLVIGVLALAVGLFATLLRPGPLSVRLAGTVPLLAPLVWILPGVWADAVNAVVGSAHDLPFEPGLFWTPGLLLWAAVAVGGAVAVVRSRFVAHRSLAVLAVLIAVSALASITFDHRNDATYTRMLPTFFLAIGALAGLAIGEGADRLRKVARWRGTNAVAVTVLFFILLAVPLAAHQATPYYRIFDGPSWASAAAFSDSGAGPDDIFLADPWRAPFLNAVTGALPHAVLHPGSPPVNGADFDHYIRSGGADAEWLAARDIDYVVAPIAPNAPHDVVGPGVYRLQG